ncbi:hypothetical protein ES703_07302 [subsurface metagenome]
MRSLTCLTYLSISLVIAVTKSNGLKHGHCKGILFSIAVTQPIISKYLQIFFINNLIQVEIAGKAWSD